MPVEKVGHLYDEPGVSDNAVIHYIVDITIHWLKSIFQENLWRIQNL